MRSCRLFLNIMSEEPAEESLHLNMQLLLFFSVSQRNIFRVVGHGTK